VKPIALKTFINYWKSVNTKREIQAKAHQWFDQQGWTPFAFQQEAWNAFMNHKHGILNAPTGSGKTYALALPILLTYLQPGSKRDKSGLQALWISPIRALTKEIQSAVTRAAEDLDIPWEIAVRTGDTPASQKKKQQQSWPEFLITTPESLHLMLAQKKYYQIFKNLKAVVVDEWHELCGSKRGVQVELALSRLKGISAGLQIWGISATIGNMQEAAQVLLGADYGSADVREIRADLKKDIEVITLLPDTIEKFPWAGHLGIKLLDKVAPVLLSSKSTLLFTNTRSQAEIWYQQIIDNIPEMVGQIAIHHGSIDGQTRAWVEQALHHGILKVVVCTSSLDLGVDFRPVETVIQVGGPKGVNRFLQRAGRSRHQPGTTSRIYFVPTHSLELLEGAALRLAIKEGALEHRQPYRRSFDVLVQYLVTLAVSEGFDQSQVYQQIKQTYSYQTMTIEEWEQILDFIVTGGPVLSAYDEYKKVVLADGLYWVESRRMALRHRLSIGTIVGDPVLEVRFVSGGRLGTIEESFVSKLRPGDTFWFSGRNLRLYRIRDMKVLVKRAKSTKGVIPAWMGGRMPLSSQLAGVLKRKLDEASIGGSSESELTKIDPLIALQQTRSRVPGGDQLLIETLKSREGHHVFVFPFQGRFVHEGMASLLAYRLSLIKPLSFSIAMNDYGFELLSDQPIPIDHDNVGALFSPEHLLRDIQTSMNLTEMARRKFREIATIAGLVFKGYPNKPHPQKHLQSSTQLLFDVFQDYHPENILLKQAYQEVMDFQLEEQRLRQALEQIVAQEIVITQPKKFTPFAFPILVDRLREKISYEKLEDRIKKMTLQLEKI